MTPAAAAAGPRPPVIAFLGESQVGKSSLVNALAGEKLLPTTGTGAPKSQAVCECELPVSPLIEGTWRVAADWLAEDRLVALAMRSLEGGTGARARLLREGLHAERIEEFARCLQAIPVQGVDLSALAVGRDAAWLPIDTPVPVAMARRQLGVMTAGWPAALARAVRVTPSGKHALSLVDLPGLGHDDVGGEASAAWLRANAPSVAAVVCVVGRRLPELLGDALREYWGPEELRQRLYLVATFADHLVEDASSETERALAARARRLKASEQLAAILGLSVADPLLFPRTFCLDPRPESRHWKRVEFDGELDRLRTVLSALPPRAPGPIVADPVSAPPASGTHQHLLRPAFQRGESLEAWLERAVLPLLRKGAWEAEPLRSGRKRLHLQASDSRGSRSALITIYGTGEAYWVAGARKVRLTAPDSELAAHRLREELLAAAKDVGVSLPNPIQHDFRSMR